VVGCESCQRQSDGIQDASTECVQGGLKTMIHIVVVSGACKFSVIHCRTHVPGRGWQF
jgi:hypothetical protein